MPNLWYNSDEVAEFHPLVVGALNNAMVAGGYDQIAEIVHHPAIPNSSIIPDFGIRLRASQRYIFICEVKRTERDVESQRYQNQTRTYVTDIGAHWDNNYQKYFCITNIERLLLFADRQGPLSTCLLKNNPKQHTKFNPATHDATQSIADLQNTFSIILQLVFNRTLPDWDNNWGPIIDAFHLNFTALKNSLGYPESLANELSLYELFRLLAYAYLRDYYTLVHSPIAAHFRNYPGNNLSLDQYRNNLTNNFDRITQLDFRQVFANHPNQVERIFPENFSAINVQYFKNIVQCFNQYSYNAVADNSSPSYVFNLLTSRIYERAELHRKGKVMSDTEIANLLAALCIDSDTATILDPGSGDGALLDAAYDQIYLQSLNRNIQKTHNQFLLQIHGIEIDPFLSQLSSFRLLSKNLIQINNQSEANISIGDIFDHPMPGNFDVVLMNPPFVRNDDPIARITPQQKAKMIQAIQAQNLNCFVTNASQPNLYFYFVNYILHYLRDEGKAGIILMAKFLNNVDGEYLKDFIADKVEAIISYPRKYFQEFTVTTVIVILKRGHNSENVSFLRVTDENLLLNPDAVKTILNNNVDLVTATHKLKHVPRNTLVASANWRKYLLDQKYEDFLGIASLIEIEHHFEILARGSSETSGGSDVIYPKWDDALNHFYALGDKVTAANKKLGVLRTRINIPPALNQYIGYGIKNNFVRRNYSLSIDDLELEKGFHFPAKSDRTTVNGLLANLQINPELNQFFTECVAELTLPRWRSMVNSAFNSTLVPKIIIPRADRTKHVVYYNPHSAPITLTTNFVYCSVLQNGHPDVNQENQYKFISAFLLSVFGQIQFELESNNQEGLRKLELFQIKRFRIPNLVSYTVDEIQGIVAEFNAINIANIEFNGSEGLNTTRRNLDVAIGTLIFSRNSLGFENVSNMVDYFELFLADLVEDRFI